MGKAFEKWWKTNVAWSGVSDSYASSAWNAALTEAARICRELDWLEPNICNEVASTIEAERGGKDPQ